MSAEYTENLIIWQKWADPFGEDDDLLDTDMSSIMHQDQDVYTDDPIEDTETPNDIVSPVFSKKIRVMATPMGIIPFTDNTASSKIFNFWIGHSNFNITKKITSIIEETKGVETLDIFTRYRFRVGIGKAFKDSEVMHSINQRVYEYLG